ncbi:hypothetical protein LTR56_010644 [Elasticomyces elasticus]|nr:hypothetical protein LTR56_010644 [Elasticomyces elasticus]KAK3648618.1 hypothetical protein LTR22_013252 [Elasticomyces elasticus]
MDKETLQGILFHASILSSITKHIIEAEDAKQRERKRKEFHFIDVTAVAREIYEAEMRGLNSGKLVEVEMINHRGYERQMHRRPPFYRRTTKGEDFIFTPWAASEYEKWATKGASDRIEFSLMSMIEKLEAQVTQVSSYDIKRNVLVALCKLGGWIHDPVQVRSSLGCIVDRDFRKLRMFLARPLGDVADLLTDEELGKLRPDELALFRIEVEGGDRILVYPNWLGYKGS